jgi:peptidoglycan L-alanyl-D-glutamate endopeptidase CwlK
MFKFSKKSELQLTTVHPDLARVCERALQLSPIDFMILQGRRTQQEQEKNVAAGMSQTMRSRHLTGHAIDFGAYVNGAYVNGDTPAEYEYYIKIAAAFKKASDELKIPIVWGGSWKSLKDGGHIELDRKSYP